MKLKKDSSHLKKISMIQVATLLQRLQLRKMHFWMLKMLRKINSLRNRSIIKMMIKKMKKKKLMNKYSMKWLTTLQLQLNHQLVSSKLKRNLFLLLKILVIEKQQNLVKTLKRTWKKSTTWKIMKKKNKILTLNRRSKKMKKTSKSLEHACFKNKKVWFCVRCNSMN